MEENSNNNIPSYSKTRAIIWIIVAIFLASVIFYFLGFRFYINNFRLVPPGSIELQLEDSGDVIMLIDNLKKRVSFNRDSDAKVNFVTAGPHIISVIKDGFWPWQKEAVIKSGESLKINPILISKEPTGEVIESGSEIYKTLSDRSLAGASASISTSSDGQILLARENNILKIKYLGSDLSNAPLPFCTGNQNCEPEIVVFSSKDQIRAFDFYKDRNDVALIAVSSGIYAIELSAGEFQNFQPVYKGKAPLFAFDEENNIYIFDEGALMKLH